MKDTRNVILITGASSGLGMGMATEYAKQGKHLVLCARRIDNLRTIKKQLNESFPKATVSVYQLDVDDHPSVFKVFDEVYSTLGSIDRIIVNAGVGRGASVGTGYFEVNKQTAYTNFISALAQCEAAVRIFKQQGHGHLVTMSSISALRGFRRAMTVYAASKAALSTLSEGIRVDLIDTPTIKVSAIHPGFIRSELNKKVDKMPFLIDLETGCKALVKSIGKERPKTYVPSYPWLFLSVFLKIAPVSLLRRLS